MSEKIVKPERAGGFIDFLPADYLAREKMLQTIEAVFRSFGFDPIETPILEFTKTLAGETSDTGKNIFHVKSKQDDAPLALRFDHTVPFARLLAANPYDPRTRSGLRLPWRRMVVGPVFRTETPQSGRYRQFYQFDADIAGTTSMSSDAEIVSLMYTTFAQLGIKNFEIRLNNRKILNGLSESVNITSMGNVPVDDITKQMMRILDKIDTIGIENVLTELQKAPENSYDPAPNLSDKDVEKVKAYLDISGDNQQKLQLCSNVFAGIKIAEEGVNELQQILNYLDAMNIPENIVKIDFSIARGLDYYTGPVMETMLLDAKEIGSVFSGGRFNNLVSRFTGQELPAVGASIGVDRLFAALNHLGLIDRERTTVTEVMVLRLVPDQESEYLKIASEIRAVGLNTEVCLLDDTTFKSQFNFVIGQGVNFVIIYGEDEFQKNTLQVRNLQTREQKEIQRGELTDYMTSLVANK